jgi:hypothetical protein
MMSTEACEVNAEGGKDQLESGPLITARTLAEALGEDTSVSSIYRMAARGLIPSVPYGPKLGGRRFSERAVRSALAKLHRPLRPYHPPKDSDQRKAAAPKDAA